LCQGQLSVTESHLYFYSKFNQKTLVGKSTKIALAFTDIKLVSKENNVLGMPNCIRFTID